MFWQCFVIHGLLFSFSCATKHWSAPGLAVFTMQNDYHRWNPVNLVYNWEDDLLNLILLDFNFFYKLMIYHVDFLWICFCSIKWLHFRLQSNKISMFWRGWFFSIPTVCIGLDTTWTRQSTKNNLKLRERSSVGQIRFLWRAITTPRKMKCIWWTVFIWYVYSLISHCLFSQTEIRYEAKGTVICLELNDYHKVRYQCMPGGHPLSSLHLMSNYVGMETCLGCSNK